MKRIPRELLGDFRKYLVVSLFLILTIGFVSGMYVANESMMRAAAGVSRYNLEDGFDRLNKAVHYAYAWKYVNEPADEKEEKSFSDNLLNALFLTAMLFNNEITDYSPRYANPAINFATGFTRGELVGHYLTMPVIVTFIAAGIGNILGYSVFKYVVESMYYNSYSLPTYETIWNPDAFVKTTLIPVALMFVVNLVVIIKMM